MALLVFMGRIMDTKTGTCYCHGLIVYKISSLCSLCLARLLITMHRPGRAVGRTNANKLS